MAYALSVWLQAPTNLVGSPGRTSLSMGWKSLEPRATASCGRRFFDSWHRIRMRTATCFCRCGQESPIGNPSGPRTRARFWARQGPRSRISLLHGRPAQETGVLPSLRLGGGIYAGISPSFSRLGRRSSGATGSRQVGLPGRQPHGLIGPSALAYSPVLSNKLGSWLYGATIRRSGSLPQPRCRTMAGCQ